MKENSIEEDMKRAEDFINLSFLYGRLGFTKKQLYEYQEAIAHILSELEKKDKIINLMAEEFVNKTLMYSDKTKQEVKQYFERKATNDG